MTGATIGQFCQECFVSFSPRAVAMQAPAHIDILTRFCYRHLAELSMAGFTVNRRGNMRAVVEIDEIGQDEDRHPLDRLVVQHCIFQFLLVFVLDSELLVATPALGLGGQPGGIPLPGTRMAIQALNAEPQVKAVVELDRLAGRLLGKPDAISARAQNEDQEYTGCNQENWLSHQLHQRFTPFC